MQALEPSAGDELERMLARFARVRLDPSPTQTRQARARVVEEAWRRHISEIDASAAATQGKGARFRRVPFATWRPRRITLSLAAAVLAGLLVGSSAFAASRAGGPLYEARITVEALMLPSDPSARLNAQLEQAQARLADIVDATGRSDPGAVAAAIKAYDQAVSDLGSTTELGTERARVMIELHVGVLEQLLAGATGPSAQGLENAVSHSSSVIERFDAGAIGPANGSTNAGGNNGNGAGANGTNNGNGAGANGTNNDNANGGNPGVAPGQADRTPPPNNGGGAPQAPERPSGN